MKYEAVRSTQQVSGALQQQLRQEHRNSLWKHRSSLWEHHNSCWDHRSSRWEHCMQLLGAPLMGEQHQQFMGAPYQLLGSRKQMFAVSQKHMGAPQQLLRSTAAAYVSSAASVGTTTYSSRWQNSISCLEYRISFWQHRSSNGSNAGSCL